MKSKVTAYILWLFLGLIGAHKFYTNQIGMGILYFFTFGVFGLGLLIDLFTLSSQVDLCNLVLGNRMGNNITVNVQNTNINQQ